MASEDPWDNRSDKPYHDEDLCGIQEFLKALMGPRGAKEAMVEEQNGGFGDADDEQVRDVASIDHL